MSPHEEKIESLLNDLPDERSARLFLDRVAGEQPRAFQLLKRERGLLSDILALVAWSPLLGTTIEQNPEYVSWLARERTNSRVRTRDELRESLARFALTHSTVEPQILFARFRRRELLRIYLHDIRNTHTLVETTEELSNLADAVLEYALNLARQDLDNRYGTPRHADPRGRSAPAEFSIVALGKLGSLELNYSSDIDLLFLYSDEGTTSGTGSRGEATNREYFVKLAETVAKLVGQPAGEGAAYRVDLRLRPYGRDGALASSLAEAVRYYRETAQSWELQALIRSRAAAGSLALFSRFFDSLRDYVYRGDVSVQDALASVRLAKQKIDRHIERQQGGFNVKLNRGGIREIEFIAQALQLAHGGRDEWLRVAHTLISLGRLADRNLISEPERTQLVEAYRFLRSVEHRLQMEHGLQTHLVPQSPEQQELLARRLNFAGPEPIKSFLEELAQHTKNVRKAFDRVFATPDDRTPTTEPCKESGAVALAAPAAASLAAAKVFLRFLPANEAETLTTDSLAESFIEAAGIALSRQRALAMMARIAASLEKSGRKLEIPLVNLNALISLGGSSEFFAEMIASNPDLILSLTRNSPGKRRDYRAVLRNAVEEQKNFSRELSVLRREWAGLLVDIGRRDASDEISLLESNQLQTELAIASINVAFFIARREVVRRYGRLSGEMRIAALAIGRLGSGGVDYGSDLDLILIYDSLRPSPIASLSGEEVYARLAESMIAALSSLTRDGYLYRVDLRLRPDGRNGPLVINSQAFLDYVKQRTDVWEWLAYVKLRAIAGELEMGRMVETHARHAVHERARKADPESLKEETRRVRERLEKEKGGRRKRRAALDVKYAAGGMLDVYFAVRYLQLRDDVRDEGEDRSTRSTLARLHAAGSLELKDFNNLAAGYELLRSVDHELRLILGQSGRMPASDHPALIDVANRLGFSSGEFLTTQLKERMSAIRESYNRITGAADQA